MYFCFLWATAHTVASASGNVNHETVCPIYCCQVISFLQPDSVKWLHFIYLCISITAVLDIHFELPLTYIEHCFHVTSNCNIKLRYLPGLVPIQTTKINVQSIPTGKCTMVIQLIQTRKHISDFIPWKALPTLG